MHPFFAAEIGDTFDLNQHLKYRMLPLGLEQFQRDYPKSIPLLLYRGKQRIKKGNILCLPVESFLKNLSPLNLDFGLGKDIRERNEDIS
jgi:hypothetical protein